MVSEWEQNLYFIKYVITDTSFENRLLNGFFCGFTSEWVE